ncbi:hypothetical protein CS0771_77090 [Catellatospora sp. IY07-71]|nr:hypothetical protein CS0771_77090 [Catellatospora sp. IY07-71]
MEAHLAVVAAQQVLVDPVGGGCQGRAGCPTCVAHDLLRQLLAQKVLAQKGAGNPIRAPPTDPVNPEPNKPIEAVAMFALSLSIREWRG